ncbi:VgrG protein [Minicystis rosea]|nr:VgrG protein [Minicystis rosea]
MSSASISSRVGAPKSEGHASLYVLRAGPFVQGELRVIKFKGRETLSKPFAFEILFDTDLPPWELEAALVGQSATFVIHAPGHATRLVHGIAAWLRAENAWKDDHMPRKYTLRLVPSVWKLGKRVNTRIFQDQAASDVITTVMREAGLAVRFDLSAPLPQRAYCVQYQESDLAFITRLLAEAGCYFYFEPPSGLLEQVGLGAAGGAVAGAVGALGGLAGAAGGVAGAAGLVETLVVSDAASFYPAIAGSLADELVERAAGAVGNAVVSNIAAAAPSLVHRDPQGMQHEGENAVTRISLRRAVRTNAVMLRDYLYERPLYDARGTASSLLPSGTAAAGTLATAALNDVGSALRGGGAGGNIAGAALDMLASLPADLQQREVYRHQSDFFEQDAKTPNAQRQLEQHRRRALEAEGESRCRRLSPGYKFTLTEHEEPRMNRAWVVTSVRHRGVTTALAHEAGHEGGDIVQYENSFTCAPAELTIRPRRPPPRAIQVADTAVVVGPAGKEVYTDALGRIKVQFHWDRLGAKDEHSSCWIRVLHSWSGSSWGTQFIPRIGMEVLVLYHQGDPDKPVVIGCLPNTVMPQPFPLPEDATRSGLRTNTLPSNGGHNELSFEDRAGSEQVFLRAQRNYDELVLLDHSVDVGRNEQETVRGSRNATIHGNEALVIGGELATTVAGDRTESVRGDRTNRVEGNSKDTVDGIEHRAIGGSTYLTTRGNYQVMVAGSSGIVVGSREKPGESHTAVWGKNELFASDEIRIQSEKTIVLECGDSRVTLSPDEVRIEAKAIVVDGHESTSIFGKKPVMHFTDNVTLASDQITLTAKGASLDLGTNATLLGAQVKLAKGSSASTQTRDPAKGETKPFKLQLTDASFEPYANKQYDLMAGGQRFHGTTDGSGNVSEDIPKGATVADLTLWLKPPPTGTHLRWQVQIDDELPPASDVRGAQIRLRNLGYFTGDPDGKETDGLRDAIRAFQRDQDLPNDGKLGARRSASSPRRTAPDAHAARRKTPRWESATYSRA